MGVSPESEAMGDISSMITQLESLGKGTSASRPFQYLALLESVRQFVLAWGALVSDCLNMR